MTTGQFLLTFLADWLVGPLQLRATVVDIKAFHEATDNPNLFLRNATAAIQGQVGPASLLSLPHSQVGRFRIACATLLALPVVVDILARRGHSESRQDEDGDTWYEAHCDSVVEYRMKMSQKIRSAVSRWEVGSRGGAKGAIGDGA